MADGRITELLGLTPRQVDRETGVIRNVALLGAVSKNKRRYTEGALDSAVGLFESAQVFANHADGDRDVRDLVGRITAARRDDGYVRGDIEVLEHQRSWVLPLVESGGAGSGMSWDGYAQWRQAEDDIQEVTAVKAVRSVDIVAKPATTRNFYESEGPEDESGVSEQWKEMVGQLQEQLTAKASEASDLADQVQTLTAERDALQGELDGLKRREAFREMVAACGLDAEKLPDGVAESLIDQPAEKVKPILEALKATRTEQAPESDPASGPTQEKEHKLTPDAVAADVRRR